MTRLNVKRGCFLASLSQEQESILSSRLKGKTAALSIYGIEISKTTSSYADFCAQMKEREATFIESLKL